MNDASVFIAGGCLSCALGYAASIQTGVVVLVSSWIACRVARA